MRVGRWNCAHRRGAGGSSGSSSSSPVVRTATRGGRATGAGDLGDPDGGEQNRPPRLPGGPRSDHDGSGLDVVTGMTQVVPRRDLHPDLDSSVPGCSCPRLEQPNRLPRESPRPSRFRSPPPRRAPTQQDDQHGSRRRSAASPATRGSRQWCPPPAARSRPSTSVEGRDRVGARDVGGQAPTERLSERDGFGAEWVLARGPGGGRPPAVALVGDGGRQGLGRRRASRRAPWSRLWRPSGARSEVAARLDRDRGLHPQAVHLELDVRDRLSLGDALHLPGSLFRALICKVSSFYRGLSTRIEPRSSRSRPAGSGWSTVA